MVCTIPSTDEFWIASSLRRCRLFEPLAFEVDSSQRSINDVINGVKTLDDVNDVNDFGRPA